MTTVEQVNQTLLNLFCGDSTTGITPELMEKETGEPAPASSSGPFQDQLRNDVWRVLASQMMENYDQLSDIDMLEPSPANRNEAMRNVRLK
eukprot:2863619-Rhodomonas_salina.1